MVRPRLHPFIDVPINRFMGLDLRGSPELAPERSFLEALNVEIGLNGEIRKRPGIVRKHNAATLGAFKTKIIGTLQTSLKQQLLVQTEVVGAAGKLWRSSDGGVTWTQVSTPAATNYQFARSIQYLNVCYIPGNGGISTWDGTTFTPNIAGTPNGSTTTYALFRLFVIENFSTLRFSDAGALTTFPAANSIGFSGDDELIEGIINYRDRIVIFRTNSIYVLSIVGPPTSWVLKELNLNLGVGSADNGFIIVNDVLYVLSWDGLFKTDLTQVEELSIPIKSIFQKRRQQYRFILGIADCIAYWNGRLICSIITDLNTVRMFVYNINNKTWTEWLPALPTALAGPPAFSPVRTAFSLVGGQALSATDYNPEGLYFTTWDANGKIYFFDDETIVYTDEVGTNYQSKIRTNKIDVGDSAKWKRAPIALSRVRGPSGTVQGRYYVNDVAGALFNIPANGVLKEVKMKGPGYFRIIEVEISDTAAQDLQIDDIVLRTKSKISLTDAKT